MSRIDQFESVFKSAAKTVFRRKPITFSRGLIVVDLPDYEARLFEERVRTFTAALNHETPVEWIHVSSEATRTVGGLLDTVEAVRPDVICTYRNLHSSAWKWPYTLGDHLEVLTQATQTPVLALPRPDDSVWDRGLSSTETVMALTDHLTGDDRLVNMAAAFTRPSGTLHLAHVEDKTTFDRYMSAIEKVASIDTETARTDLYAQLLKEPSDYIATCERELADRRLRVMPTVTLGNHLEALKVLIEKHTIDLLVINTKDDDQMAMHGLAYPLAIELRHTPMVML